MSGPFYPIKENNSKRGSYDCNVVLTAILFGLLVPNRFSVFF